MIGGLSPRTVVAGALLVAVAVFLNVRETSDSDRSLSVVIRCPPDVSGELRFSWTSEANRSDFALPDACYDTALRIPDYLQVADLSVALVVEGVPLQTLTVDPAADLRSDPEGPYIVFDVLATQPYLSVSDL